MQEVYKVSEATMNPKILLLVLLLPCAIPFIISIGVVFGLIPLSAGTSPRLPIIFTFVFGFLLIVGIWKWRSPEIQAKLSASSASKIEKTPTRNLLLAQILMIIIFTFLGIGAGLFILNAGVYGESGHPIGIFDVPFDYQRSQFGVTSH